MRPGARSEPDLGRKLSVGSAFDVGSLQSAVRQGRGQGRCALLAEWHLQVLPGGHRSDRVAKSPDEVGHHESGEAPLLAQDVGEQVPVLPCPGSVHRVIGAHHTIHAGVDDGAEVRQECLTQHVLVDPDVDPEPRLLHRVEREVFDTGEQPPVHALHRRGAHCAHQHRILAVGLLCPPPAGGIGDVDADAGPQVGALRARLGSDGVGDGCFHIRIPRRGPGDGNRKRGRCPQCHTAWTVGELDAGYAEPVDTAGLERDLVVSLRHLSQAPPDRQVAVEEPQQLRLGQSPDQVRGSGLEVPLAAADGLHRRGEGRARWADRVGDGPVRGRPGTEEHLCRSGIRRCGRAGLR